MAAHFLGSREAFWALVLATGLGTAFVGCTEPSSSGTSDAEELGAEASSACAHDVLCTGAALPAAKAGAGCTTSSGANAYCVPEVCADLPSCCSTAWTNACVQDLEKYTKAGGYKYADCPTPSANPAPACSSPIDGGSPDSGTRDGGPADAGHDAGSDAGKDAGAEGGVDSGTGDGTPTRNACTSTFGSALKGSFGRLDGYVVSVVVPSSSSKCNADSSHIHIQVEMNNAVYDVAVNVDGGYVYEANIPLPGAAWSEGWYQDGLDYEGTLGVSSSEFTAISQSALTTKLESELATANHITVFGTTYTGSDAGSGMHDIHYESTNKDGAVFLDPLSADAHALLFRFSGDSF